MTGRIVIEKVFPAAGRSSGPAKAVVGELFPVTATIWKEGHDALAAVAVWRSPEGDEERVPMRLADEGTDRWQSGVTAHSVGEWTVRIEAWRDPWSTWCRTVRTLLASGRTAGELANDLETGARLLTRMAGLWDAQDRRCRTGLLEAADSLRDTRRTPRQRAAAALGRRVQHVARQRPLREHVTSTAPRRIWVDRRRALFGAWYEMFPRSTGGVDETGRPVHGTFATAAAELPRIAAMGFDVLYLPPIHPIGTVHRKGRNNALTADATDVGSPWAIGSRDGGHDAVHPALGDLDGFRAFVRQARAQGLEIALDLAFQAAPDHPWVTEHPEWFTTRPDGSVACAENPPKRYEDIHPLNFDDAPETLYAELERIVRFWMEQGVRIFRVDNPHTKPADFWHWLIWRIKGTDPDVLFLAEAFTRPAVLKGLARLGFSQSYTYFTWRTGREELADYLRELAEDAHFLRPNLFVNTPDILPAHLHHAGPQVFAARAALAATAAPTWGVYEGFELCENTPLHPGSEEYLDSEKYQLRPRDPAAARAAGTSLESWIALLNRVRREHPALQQLRHVRVLDCDNDRIIAYSKHDPLTGDTVLCAVSLAPDRPQTGVITLAPHVEGTARDTGVRAHNALTGRQVRLGKEHHVRFGPGHGVLRVLAWNSHE
ncbi:maltotransferase domain-containing protein [Streptomyces rimosus]|uniref:maltotransferase domain-containing protein n=1 Tax=Streptomyces rimosus TaxID=1927 RepID=UPI0004C0DEA1|nr:maltotransferase domain-containing protein [Streptomyces rimosus]